MNFEDFGTVYKAFVDHSVQLEDDRPRERLGLGSLGLLTEGGEAMDHIKKFMYHGKNIDRPALIKELGDHLWYLTLILDTLEISWTEVMATNILKLTERYPEKYGDMLDTYREIALDQLTEIYRA